MGTREIWRFALIVTASSLALDTPEVPVALKYTFCVLWAASSGVDTTAQAISVASGVVVSDGSAVSVTRAFMIWAPGASQVPAVGERNSTRQPAGTMPALKSVPEYDRAKVSTLLDLTYRGR